jgi:hypothetical protein
MSKLEKFAAAVRAIKVPDLKWNGQTLENIEVSPTVFERDGKVIVSAEDGLPFADYYGEGRPGNDPWINPALVKVAKKYGFYWEWENPGAIAVYA